MTFWPCRTMRVSPVSASQKSGGWMSRAAGSKARNAVSNPGHFCSTTVQAKPEQKIRFVISLRIRSSGNAVSSARVATLGSRVASVLVPPFRSTARARMVANGVKLVSGL